MIWATSTEAYLRERAQNNWLVSFRRNANRITNVAGRRRNIYPNWLSAWMSFGVRTTRAKLCSAHNNANLLDKRTKKRTNGQMRERLVVRTLTKLTAAIHQLPPPSIINEMKLRPKTRVEDQLARFNHFFVFLVLTRFFLFFVCYYSQFQTFKLLIELDRLITNTQLSQCWIVGTLDWLVLSEQILAVVKARATARATLRAK